MLVVCCGMPRSGSTLQYQITCELIERAGLGSRPTSWPSPVTPHMAATERPIHVAKIHDPDPRLDALDPRFIRYVYVYRDVRDAIASYVQKDGPRPPHRLARVVRRNYLHPFDHFTTQPNALVSRYETLVQDLTAEVRRIADHLGITVTPDAAASIADPLHLDAQRRYLDTVSWRDDQRWDDRTLLHRNHIGDARIGKHRDVLSPEQRHAVEQVAAPWLEHMGYTTDAVHT